MSLPISRRALLASIGGTALTFPLLSAIPQQLAHAAGVAPQRYIVMFAGMSGANGGDKRVILEPDMTPGSRFLQATKALDDRGVRDKVSFVTGMRMARDLSTPGGMGVQWHPHSKGPMLTGQRAAQDKLPATTSDQIVANAFAHPSFARGLHYRVQYDSYMSERSDAGTISGRLEGGIMTPNAPTVNAALAYQALAAQLGSADPAAKAKAQAEAARLQSSVAHVRARGRLLQQLPSEDRRRIEQHLDELSSYEKALASQGKVEAQCALPKAPTDSTALNGAYAFEKERAPLLADLIKFGFSCNLSRVATLCVTYEQTVLEARTLIASGHASPAHELSHSDASPGSVAFPQIINWHTDVFAYLVKGLASTPDVDGRTLLDNTAIVYLFEGGLGSDPETSANVHSADNLVALVAGRAAGKMPGKSEIKAAGKHPASLLLSAMRNVGVNAPMLGEISAPIPELIG
jgi:hypothetical protein